MNSEGGIRSRLKAGGRGWGRTLTLVAITLGISVLGVIARAVPSRPAPSVVRSPAPSAPVTTRGFAPAPAVVPPFTVTTEVVLESTLDFTTSGAVTTHPLAVPRPPAGGGTLELTATGNFGTSLETARAVAEGQFNLITVATGVECAPAVASRDLTLADLTGLANDGTVVVTVTNSQWVDPSCAVNRHTVRLRYPALAGSLDFGPVRTGAWKDLAITVRNTDPAAAHTVLIGSDTASFIPTETSLSIDPGASRTTTIRFAPAATGDVSGTLTLSTTLPAASTTIALTGSGTPPPVVRVEPDAMAATLPVGGETWQMLSIANLGDRPLDYDLRVERPGAGPPRRVYILDGGPVSIVTVDLDTFATTRIPLPASLSGARGLAVDDATGTAYVVTYYSGLYAVDLVTGVTRSIVAGFAGLVDIALSPDASEAYLVDQGVGKIDGVHLSDGVVRTVATGLNSPVAVSVLDSGDLLVGEQDRLLRVDVTSGAIAPLPTPIDDLAGVAAGSARGSAWVVTTAGAVIEVDLGTGAATTISRNGSGGFSAVALVGGGTQALALDQYRSAAYVIDLASGDLSALPVTFASPRDIAATPGAPPDPYTFLSVTPGRGIIAPGGTQQVTARFTAGLLPPGSYAAVVTLREGGLPTPLLSVPATLTVSSSPHLVIEGATTSATMTVVANARYDRDTLVRLRMPVLGAPQGAGELELTTEASIRGFNVSLEGRLLGGDIGVQCVRTSYTYTIPQSLMHEVTTDGVVEVEVGLRRTEDFGRTCGASRFTTRLSYPGPPDRIDFGTIETGREKTASITLRNVGDEALDLTSFRASGAAFSVALPDVALAPGSSIVVPVEFRSAAPGPAYGTLRFDTNEPGAGTIEIALEGTAVEPPAVASPFPESVESTLPAGGRGAATVAIANTGGMPLDYSLRVQGLRDDAQASLPCPTQALFAGYPLAIVDLVTGGKAAIPKGGPTYGLRYGATTDGNSRTVFVAYGADNGGAAEVDLADGHGRVLAGLSSPKGVALSGDENRVYILGDALYVVDRRTLVLSKVSETSWGEGLVLDRSETTAYVTTKNGRVLAVDIVTGASRVIASGLDWPQEIALDPAETTAYVVDWHSDDPWTQDSRLVAVDLASGAVTPIATGFDGAEAIVLDPTGATAWIGEDRGCRITAVDLATGAKTVVADDVCPYGLAPIGARECSGWFVAPADRAGTIAPGESHDLGLTLDAAGLAPGTYRAEIEIRTNDPVRPSLSVPVTLEVEADTDGDGVPDASDNCPDQANPGQEDSDADGVGDACDNCPSVANPDQADRNGDGAGDACQPSIAFDGGIRGGSGFLAASVRLTDPQGSPLTGEVSILAAAMFMAQPGPRVAVPRPAAATPLLAYSFSGRLPRTIDISSLLPGTVYLLRVTATNGTTPPVAAEARFVDQGEPRLAFNDPPVAAISAAASLECDRPGGAVAVLSASGSSDADSTPGTHDDIRSFAWTLDPGLSGERPLGEGESIEALVPLGTHTVEVRATDSIGESSTASATVQVVDTTAPAATLTATPDTLQPPDHTLRAVHLDWSVVDACDDAPVVALESVDSSEPDDAPGIGDGATRGDIRDVQAGTPDRAILLRAERAGTGPGRVYTITIRVTDRSGNVARATATVTVPHDTPAF